MPQAQDVEIPTPLSSGATDQPDVVQHGVSSKIEGLPEGAVLRPIKNTASQGQIEGLPEGAVLRPLTKPSTTIAEDVQQQKRADERAHPERGVDLSDDYQV